MNIANYKVNNNPNKEIINFSEKLGYGLGDFACNLVWNSLSMFILYFYTDVMGMKAAIISTLMLVVRIIAGFMDIASGIVVDKTKTKYGKARPWILWMAIPFGISTILLFSIPNIGESGKLVYVVITYVLLNVIYTAINIPYGVLNSLMTQDQNERSEINIYRMFCSTAGSLCVSVLVLPLVSLFGGEQGAWIITFAIFGIVATFMFFITFKTTKERVTAVNEEKSQNISFKDGMKALIQNKYWIIIVLLLVVLFMNMGIMGGSMIYYAQYILNGKKLVGGLSIAQNIPTLIVMLTIAMPLIKKYGKRNTAISGSIIFILGSLFALIDLTSVKLIYISIIVKGTGNALISATVFALLADTIEYGEWKTNVRTEGLVYSAGNFGLKIGIGLGTAIVGWLLAFSNYNGSSKIQTNTAINAINILFIWLPMILSGVQIILLKFYKLDKIYPNIISDLENRKI
ncbi:MFS transporter [Clostridium botulinum]|uniref:Sugar transporter n=3 Tax=Clostridium botulinum TaxID=1491 RepID=C1FKS4_CLOBJ|nr:MFS transporter [Clostridium botulinum]ACO83465.1 sugar transporter [Clostridium botulinum A2 str. Kyoto]APH23622.1 sugar (Glycoside-Pentoside-Hexuronide) transporter domain protein [Clostridium botulinum]APQ68330.1 sugar (Glycoside-Pentoside-Hexuronide) transporter domain protein [Clostridium botulinum]AUN06367.1 MFS transporter [Clostridium botulinum]EPS53997.1 sugar transporter [Clostridium botulinum Af84]